MALGAVIAAIRGIDVSMPAAPTLLAGCRAWLLPQPGVIVLLSLGALGVAVGFRAARSARRAYRAARVSLRALRPCGVITDPLGAVLVDDSAPRAFCAGLLRPRIYLSSGALDKLGAGELRAVLAHEAHHAERRDPLRRFVTQVLGDALFFLPVLRSLRHRCAALAELAADEAAIKATGSRWSLASALLAFGQVHEESLVGVSPERVDHLLGEPWAVKLPRSQLVGALATLAGLSALVLALASTRIAPPTNIPLLLMQSCGWLILAVTGLAIAAIVHPQRS